MRINITILVAAISFAANLTTHATDNEWIRAPLSLTDSDGISYTITGIWQRHDYIHHSALPATILSYPPDTVNWSVALTNVTPSATGVAIEGPKGNEIVPARIFAIDLGQEWMHVTVTGLNTNSRVEILSVTSTNENIRNIGVIDSSGPEPYPSELQVTSTPYGERHGIVLILCTDSRTKKEPEKNALEINLYVTVYRIDSCILVSNFPSDAPIVFTDSQTITVDFGTPQEVRPFYYVASRNDTATISCVRNNGHYCEIPWGFSIHCEKYPQYVHTLRVYPRIPTSWYFNVGNSYEITPIWYADGTYPFVDYP